MLDIAVAFNRYRFLGNEFLTWLWFAIDTRGDDPLTSRLSLGNRMVLERRQSGNAVESITIKGDDAGLEEAFMALKKGALVTVNLVICSPYLSSNRKVHPPEPQKYGPINLTKISSCPSLLRSVL